MENLRLKGEWNELKGRIKQIYGDLIDQEEIRHFIESTWS
jgi:uncharacterized protein YjbJ (UPF0337 family)